MNYFLNDRDFLWDSLNQSEFEIVLVFYLRVVVGATQEHLADRALSLPTEPKRVISQAPVHSARLPVKLSPDQISNLHDSKISGHSGSF